MEQPDYLVVGAGSAGAVLAARLSEDPRRRVLLLEAGPDHRSQATPAGISGPSMWSALASSGRVWPSLHARYADGAAAPYPRGRGAGGTSAVNALIALRGIPEDYDRWSRELGCAGWDAVALATLFDAIENDLDAGPSGHPLPVQRPARGQWTPFERGLEQAALGAGRGVYEAFALTAVDGRRVSTNDAYLEPARERDNLEVRGDVLVDRVLLDDSRAVGVRTADGREIAAGHVVLAAGAIHSPAILLRSGVGVEDGLPVGRNLIDHPTASLTVLLTDAARARTNQHVVNSALRYTSGVPGTGVLDMQVVPLGYGPPPLDRSVALLCVSAMQVFSRGQVTLRNDDPSCDPDVAFSMLTDERDRVRLLDGVSRLRELTSEPALRALSTSVLAGDRPLAEVDEAQTAEWLERCVTGYAHAVGTCRMGAANDPASVVDVHCAVIGHHNLYVVDASVMPDIPRANTHLTTVAIAERIARELP